MLFIVDSDFGALGLVMYFLYRQPIAAGSRILLPVKAWEMHAEALPVASESYRSLQDILDAVDRESPDLVFLFSGYLFTLKAPSLLTFDECAKLVSELRRRGCALATSDPYLGTFRHIRKIPDKDLAPSQWARYWIQAYLTRRWIHRVADLFKDIVHVVPAPSAVLSAGGTDYVSFFNPLYVRDGNRFECSPGVGRDAPEPESGRRGWLFVLANYDLEYQQQQHGAQGFIDIVAGKLRETLDNDRVPTLIAPDDFVAAVAAQFDPDANVKLVPNCCYEEFERHLLNAEIAFYWQYFSTSNFLRLYRGLPVFFFDPGHLARINKPFLEAGLAHYFPGDPPILLDIGEPLQASRLAGFSEAFRSSARASYSRLSRLPTPGEMVENILAQA